MRNQYVLIWQWIKVKENLFKYNLCYREPAPQQSTRLPTVMVKSLCLTGSINYTQTHTGSGWTDSAVIFLRAFYKPIIWQRLFIQKQRQQQCYKCCVLHISCGKSDWAPTVFTSGLYRGNSQSPGEADCQSLHFGFSFLRYLVIMLWLDFAP